VTLSRQTTRRVQYFLAYTFGHSRGTIGGEYNRTDPYDPRRTYGVLPDDRTHVLNVSWNALLTDTEGARNPIARGLLSGWQISGISSMASGLPIYLNFQGDAGAGGIAAAYFGTPDVVGLSANGQNQGNGLAPAYSCDPRLSGSAVGDKILSLNCIGVPPFGQNGANIPPYNVRTPTRYNHDLTLFKNFPTSGAQKFQFRIGFFNLFNQSFATTTDINDINLALDTVCKVRVPSLSNGAGGTATDVCDPSGGFDFTPQTKDNFGKINLKRGRRVVELVLKYYF